MPVSVERKVTASFALALVILTIIGLTAYRSTTHLVADAESVWHSHAVIETLEVVVSRMKDEETGTRGYVISGNVGSLQRYDAAREPLRTALAHVRELTRDNRGQQARLDGLGGLLARRAALLARTIDIRERDGFEAARKEMLSNGGAAVMGDVRRTVAEMKAEEKRLLGEHMARADASARWTRLVISLGSMLAFIFVFAAVVAIRRDLATRKSAVRLMRASEERFRAIMESAPDAMVIVDAAGAIVLANPEAERVFGYPREELIGMSVDRLVPERSRRRHPAMRDAYQAHPMRRPMGSGLELSAVRKDGSEFPIEISLSPLTTEGEPLVTTVIRDVTDRRQVQEELRNAKEVAEAANRAKSEFLANMSHEIRTPMNIIFGMTEILLDTSLDDEQREFAMTVRRSAGGLLEIINDILDFSKIEAGKLDLAEVDFNLRETLGDTVKALGTQAHGKRIELACRIHPAVPETLFGDPDRLRQIIVNLVGNAIKFTERGGVIVEARPEDADAEGLTLRVSIVDTGIGIPTDKQQEIFNSFEQADTSTTRRFGGTGLGLTISAQLVRLMGGRIWVESLAGKGSTFHFTVRLGVRRGAVVPATAPQPVVLDGLPVLVVDDSAANREILSETPDQPADDRDRREQRRRGARAAPARA